jgi:hypothetical protein
MKFKKPIEVQAGISDGDPTNPLGISGYLLSSDGSNVNWISPSGLSAETAEAIVQPIKANEALVKGDPLYIVGYQLGQDVNIVAKADSSDAAKMPVVGLADDDYASQNFGTMTAFGSFNGDFDTTGGTENWVIGDIIFVKPGGGLTNIKPGGTDLIQNVAIVSRVNSQTGELEVIALGRTNDVPNLPTGRLFVGTAANTSLASDVIYVDDTNDRVGIGTTSPQEKLHVMEEAPGTTLIEVENTRTNSNAGIKLSSGQTNYNAAFTNANGDFQIYNSTTNKEELHIGANGNVGIGATSPNSKLQVDGEIDANGGDGYRINGKPWAAESSNNLKLGDWDGEGFTTTIYDDTSAPVVIVKQSNVGIGTTSPSTSLEVSSSGVNGVDISQSASNASQSGRLFFTTNTASEGFALFNSNGTFQVNSGGIPNNTSGTNRISIIGSSGNVGIDTTSPRTKLHVSGLTGDDDPTLGSSTAPLFISNTANSYGLNVGVNNVGASWLQAQSNTSSTAYEMSLNPLGGNVGVGQINPSYKLDVNGSLGCTSFEMGNLKMFTTFGSIFINGTTNGNTIFYGAPASFTQNLQVNGTVTCVNLVQTSQTDKKKDISNIDKSKAKTIQFKEYKYKEGDGDRKRYGVLVEDLENDYPELVHVGADGVKGINYIDLLVKRVAELEKELEDISLTPGAKGDTGAAGGDGKDGNSHLSNVTSIAFNPKAGRLEVNISGTVYNFVPSK